MISTLHVQVLLSATANQMSIATIERYKMMHLD